MQKTQDLDVEFEQRDRELVLLKKQISELKKQKKKESGDDSKQIVESASQVVATMNKKVQSTEHELEVLKKILEKERDEHNELKKKTKS